MPLESTQRLNNVTFGQQGNDVVSSVCPLGGRKTELCFNINRKSAVSFSFKSRMTLTIHRVYKPICAICYKIYNCTSSPIWVCLYCLSSASYKLLTTASKRLSIYHICSPVWQKGARAYAFSEISNLFSPRIYSLSWTSVLAQTLPTCWQWMVKKGSSRTTIPYNITNIKVVMSKICLFISLVGCHFL